MRRGDTIFCDDGRDGCIQAASIVGRRPPAGWLVRWFVGGKPAHCFAVGRIKRDLCPACARRQLTLEGIQ